MSRSLPLSDVHLKLNAKMVDFHGWQMPLHYGSQIDEHRKVREHVGLFDVSHMTVVDILGAGGRQFLRQLLANDVDRLTHRGAALYSCMLNHQGGILDDLIVYYRTPDNYRLILNSATRARDLEWLQRQSNGYSLGIQEQNEVTLLALQGPDASKILYSVLTPAQMDAASTLPRFSAVEVDELFIARTGYTGEDGYELILPIATAKHFWQQWCDAGVQPCGLAARDSLRLEAGLLLYGQDMDATTTPFESALSWSVSMSLTDRDFIGRAALEMQKENGVRRKLVGVLCHDKVMMRHGMSVRSDNGGVGEITSGGYSPHLKRAIAFARMPANASQKGYIDIRGNEHAVEFVKPRFYQQGHYLVGAMNDE